MKITEKHPGCGQQKPLAVWVSAEGNIAYGYGQVEYPKPLYPKEMRMSTCGVGMRTSARINNSSWITYCQDCAAEMGLVW